MKINITNKQYALLIKILYLGDWMINANELEDDRNKEVDEFFSYILSFAKDFGMKDMIDEYKGQYMGSRKLEEDELVQKSIEDYDDEYFWDELTNMMADRDFHRRYSKEEIEAMGDWIAREEKRDEFVEKYGKEFEKYGLERLEVKSDNI